MEPRTRAFLLAASLTAAALLLASGLQAADYPPAVKKAVNSILDKELQRHCEVLASDAYEGREAGTKGGLAAACYVAGQFERCGLRPGGEGGTWFRKFPIGQGAPGKKGELADANWIEVFVCPGAVSLKRFAFGKEFFPYSFSGLGFAAGEVLFVGYGIEAPELGFDEYKGLDLKGKVVLLLSEEPKEKDPKSPFDGTSSTPHAEALRKAKLAESKGAAAVLIVPNPLHHEADAPRGEGETAWPPADPAAPRLSVPCACVSPAVAQEILRAEKGNLKAAQEKIDGALKPAPVAFKKASVHLRVAAQGDEGGAGINVVGVLEGRDPALKDECVVIGAHYDHVGFGRFASMGKPGAVHNGANDNASGTAGVIVLARAFTEFQVETKRSIVFVAFDGEEKGLLGAKAYVNSPAFPIDRTAAMLNMDMIGRGNPGRIFVGGGTLNKTMNGILSRISAQFQMGLDLKGLDSFLQASDQAPFMDKGVPCIFVCGGMHAGYHTPEDDTNLLLGKKMESIVRTLMLVAFETADLKERP
jgi:Zn-dependent M28 family amino/carboxypeptidase